MQGVRVTFALFVYQGTLAKPDPAEDALHSGVCVHSLSNNPVAGIPTKYNNVPVHPYLKMIKVERCPSK